MTDAYNPQIEVCDSCLKAACWQGIFMCDDSYQAGTQKLTVSALIEIDREHPDYWNNELNSANKPLLTPQHLEALGAKGYMLKLSEKPGVL